MSNKKSGSYRILFRTNTDWSLGLGHLARCRSLMMEFSTAVAAEFTLVTNSLEVSENFLGEIAVDLVEAGTDWPKNGFDLAIVDAPQLNAAEGDDLRRCAKSLVCIDDEGPGLADQDVLIRPNFLNRPRPKTLPKDKPYWSGGDYLILHPNFKPYAQFARKQAPTAKRLLVCFGGSDPGQLTLRLLPLLRRLDVDIQFDIVLGAAFQGEPEVFDLIAGDTRFRVRQNLANMAQMIWEVDGAVISGGTLLYEVGALGVPAIVLSQNEAQDDEAKHLEKAGAILNLGVHRRISDQEIGAALAQLINDRNRRRAMSELSRELISADGAGRIVSGLMARLCWIGDKR